MAIVKAMGMLNSVGSISIKMIDSLNTNVSRNVNLYTSENAQLHSLSANIYWSVRTESVDQIIADNMARDLGLRDG